MNWWKTIKIAQQEVEQHFPLLRQIFDQADASLPAEAQRAVTLFVGHEPMSRDKEDMDRMGLMHEHSLEDAFSANPSPEGMVVLQQLQQAFAPVKAELFKVFGPAVPLQRYQRPVKPGTKPRNVLSWTLNVRFAEELAGIRRLRPITDQEIEQAVNTFNQTGWVKFRRVTYRPETEWPSGVNLFDHEDEHITGIGGDKPNDQALREWLKYEQQELNEQITEQEKKRQFILSKSTPLDQIVWATDRANQMEFIVRMA